ncbi:mRNA export protein [Lachnellula subtilissima]|uniref:mRNA export protein n=1 Tax=Lachnellula subtilissima TaxID=602034 RepID=A0A8H8RHZ2_9HELO|nr:mRNA export protein [Lachnellula subtilissima]
MSGKLDQSLDEILSTTRRTSVGKGRRVGRRTAAKPAHVAPSNGIKKTARGGKIIAQRTPTGPSGNSESKILVTGLPKDVSEPMVKEYFQKAVGPVKRVEISYGPGGVSRGIATIVFVRSESASKALQALNGVLVDNKTIKVEVIVDAKRATALPTPKGLSERISQPKSQPKSAATTKATATRGGKASTRGAKKAKSARPTKKTAEELDSEMMDYFGGASTDAPATGAAQPAANGDANMDDEILVS